MSDEVKQLSELVMSIQAPVINIFGDRIPAMGGSSAATQGASTAASEVTNQLKQKTAEFLNALGRQDYKRHTLAQELEGLIMEEQTLSVLTEAQTEKLKAILRNLLNEKL